uniref:MDM2 protein n=1 Tax=Homo sapiens TaxID=9606 RepID=A0A0A8K972_HUMAN|nr:MDM2 protein [Homo sapiens]
MCNTNMSVPTDGAVTTSQIPASEQETLKKIQMNYLVNDKENATNLIVFPFPLMKAWLCV